MTRLVVVDYVAPLAVVFAYLLFISMTRRQLVCSAYEAFGAYVQGVGVMHPDARERLEDVVSQARPSQRGASFMPRGGGLSHGRILGAWRVARTVELAHVGELSTDETHARLLSLAATLAADEHPARRDLAARIRKVVDVPQGAEAPTPQRLAALLREAMRHDFDARDTLYESLAFEYVRASWLAYVGLGFGLVLALAFGHSELFVAGGLGGLLSRLARLLRRRPLPNDYGASWGPLILGPVAGALAGWAGVLVIGALADGGLAIFASSLKVSWAVEPGPVEVGLAFLLGFSERLFTSAVTSTTERLLPTPDAPLAPAPTTGKHSPPTP